MYMVLKILSILNFRILVNNDLIKWKWSYVHSKASKHKSLLGSQIFKFMFILDILNEKFNLINLICILKIQIIGLY